jgi:intracellular septation protein
MVKPPHLQRKLGTGLKLLLDFAPLGAFFAGYKLGGVEAATVAIIVTSLLCMGIAYVLTRTIALAPLISGGLVTVLGLLALTLKDPMFIKMKPTAVNLIFAAILLGGVYGARRGLLSYVLDVAFKLTDEGWLILSRRWGFFFLFLALVNEIVWRHFPESFWVNFKVFGMFGMTILFALSQFRLLDAYRAE